MDLNSIAAALAQVNRAQTVAAIAAEVVKQAHDQDMAMIAMIEAAVQSARADARSGPPVAGSTGAVDIRV